MWKKPVVVLWSLVRHLWRDEMLLLTPVIVLVLGGWAFIAIADEVMEGDTQQFDSWMVRAMRRANDTSVPIGPAWLAEAGRDVTALGGITVMVAVTIFVAGFLLIQKKYHAMWLALIASGTGTALSLVLKGIFSRDRPTEVKHLAQTMTSSFPSGHSMMSAVVYLTLGILLSRVVSGVATKIYVLAVAILVTFFVGVSRVYLGVHYPTDVLAGWTVGLMWAIFCWAVTRYLQRRGKIEQPTELPRMD